MYTRRGDKGETSLYGRKRVAKNSPRVEAYGTVDELNSVLGVVISESTDKAVTTSLKDLQKLLFVAGADLASEIDEASAVPRITAADTARLEKMTDELLTKVPKLRNFILPGGSKTGAHLQLARAVCRRAERKIVAAEQSEEVNPELLAFFNRLSTYLFDLSRYANKRARKKEDVWKG